jgi:hypothetical protein
MPASGIALRLDGAAGAGGGFEDVSKSDGHHAFVAAEVTRLKLIWILDFGILDGASSRRLLPASLAAYGTGAQAGSV